MGLHDGAEPVGRQVRAAVLSAVVVVVSLLAHLSGGGDRPPVTVLVAVWALLAVLLSRLTQRELGLPLVLGLLTGGQLLVHLAWGVATAATTPTVTTAAHHMAASGGSHHHPPDGIELPTAAAVVGAGNPTPPMDDSGGWAMLAAHLLAAVAVGVWLVAGERAAWQLMQVVAVVIMRSVKDLATLLGGRLGWLCPTIAGPPVPGRHVWLVAAEVKQPTLGSSSCRRGPPASGLLAPTPCR